jgi:excisionase family DNA binding protein
MSPQKSTAGETTPAALLPSDRAALRIVESSTQPTAAWTDAAMMLQVIRDLYGRLDRIEQMLRILPILVAQTADPTHLTVEGAARVLGISTKTVRRRIHSGTLTLETVAGTRRTGIPVEQVYAGVWVPLTLSRKLLDEERRELQELKRKSR